MDTITSSGALFFPLSPTFDFFSYEEGVKELANAIKPIFERYSI